MHLVDDKHLDADSFQKPRRRLLHLHDVGARTLRRAQQREQFGIEAPLSGLADHFHGQQGRSLLARTGIEARRIVVAAGCGLANSDGALPPGVTFDSAPRRRSTWGIFRSGSATEPVT